MPFEMHAINLHSLYKDYVTTLLSIISIPIVYSSYTHHPDALEPKHLAAS
jgi:hypothetical protein